MPLARQCYEKSPGAGSISHPGGQSRMQHRSVLPVWLSVIAERNRCIPLLKNQSETWYTYIHTLKHASTLEKKTSQTTHYLYLFHTLLPVALADMLVLSVHLIFRLPFERPPRSGWGRRVGRRGSREYQTHRSPAPRLGLRAALRQLPFRGRHMT